jgi:CelD/BcsL family acetyltransferase involved in cellulose biosynthesis
VRRPAELAVLRGTDLWDWAAAGNLDRLIAQAGGRFSSSALWLRAAAAAEAADPFVVVCGEKAALALTRRRRAGVEIISPPGVELVDVQDPPGAWERPLAEALADGVSAEVTRGRGPWFLRIPQLPADHPIVPALLDRLARARLVPGTPVPVARLGPDRAIDSLVSAKYRRQSRSLLARVEASHCVALDRVAEPAQLAELLPEIAELRAQRSSDRGWSDRLSDGRSGALWRRAIDDLRCAGRLEAVTMRIDECLAAFTLTVRDRPVRAVIDGRIATDWAGLSPGRSVHLETTRSALEDPSVARLEWGRGQSEYKSRITNDVLRTVEVTAGSGPLGRVAGAGTQPVRDRARVALAGRPRLDRAIRAARGLATHRGLSRPRR